MISEIQAAIASATGIQKIVKTMMEINTNDAVREKGVELNIVISDLLTALTASLVQNYQLVEESNLLKKKMAEQCYTRKIMRFVPFLCYLLWNYTI